MGVTPEPQHPASELFGDLGRSGPIPLYFQVASTIEAAIVDGRIPPGTRLQNEVDMGDRLGLSRPTVRRAMQELVDKGLLVRRRGIGTQVIRRPVTRGVELTSLYDDLEKGGRAPRTVVLSVETVPADAALATTLELAPGDAVVHLRRLRLANDEPLAVMENFLPAEFVGFDGAELADRGLYETLRSRGIQISVAEQRIGARSATRDESRLLDIPAKGAVLTMDRVAYTNAGRVIELGRHCYRPDRYSFETTVVVR